MGALSMAQMAARLQVRITQLSEAHAINALNDALAWVWRQGSYTFQMKASPPINTITMAGPGVVDAGQATIPSDCDTGKAFWVGNAPQGTPIEKRPVQDFSMSFALNLPTNMGFHVYTIEGRTLLLRPSQTSQQVAMHYHYLFVPLLSVEIPVTPSDFDEALMRLGEAEARRIYDVGSSWPMLQKEAREDALGLLAAYRSVSQEAMSQPDAAVAIQEKTVAGRG